MSKHFGILRTYFAPQKCNLQLPSLWPDRRFPGCPLISSRNNTWESLDLGSISPLFQEVFKCGRLHLDKTSNWILFRRSKNILYTQWCDDTCYVVQNGTKPIVYWMSNSKAGKSLRKMSSKNISPVSWEICEGFIVSESFLVPKFCSDCWIIARFGSGTGKSPAITWGRSFNISMEGRPGMKNPGQFRKKATTAARRNGAEKHKEHMIKTRACHLNLVHKQEIKPECAFNTPTLCSCSNPLQLLSFTTPNPVCGCHLHLLVSGRCHGCWCSGAAPTRVVRRCTPCSLV